jgi:hypothetical protein
MRPDWLEQVRTVGVRVGTSGCDTVGKGVTVLVGIDVGVVARVAEGAGDLGSSVAVELEGTVTAAGWVAARGLDEQAASPIPINRLDSNTATAFTVIPINRECTRKLAIAGLLPAKSRKPQ